MKVIRKYYTRTDVKVAGFTNLYFYGNSENKKVYLSADLVTDISKTKYIIKFTVECERQITSQRNIESLCRLILEELDNFNGMKIADKKKYAEEKGELYFNGN